MFAEISLTELSLKEWAFIVVYGATGSLLAAWLLGFVGYFFMQVFRKGYEFAQRLD
jgi:hypothetical protein